MASKTQQNKSAHTRSALTSALDRLTQLHPKLIDLGLERTLALSEKMGSPHLSLPPTFHIAGTNGKGSTAAFLRAFLEAAGFKVHVYSSPHLCRFEERIRLAGSLITEAHLCSILERIEEVNEGKPVTFFESTTVAAFTAFSETPADFLILETGLGGAFDSTNIIPEPTCSIITPIARDHEHFLGNTLSKIASAKAGILKKNCPAIFAAQQDEALNVLYKTAQSVGTGSILLEGKDFSAQHPLKDGGFTFVYQDRQEWLPSPSMAGAHQVQNASLALAALTHLQITLSAQQKTAGLEQAHWPARVQKLTTGHLVTKINRPHIWLDGAHNAHGATALAASLRTVESGPYNVIFGALNTRSEAEFLHVLKDHIHKLFTITIPNQPASRTAEELETTARQLGLDARACASLDDALTALMSDANCKGRPLLICGSLYLAGEVLMQNATLPE